MSASSRRWPTSCTSTSECFASLRSAMPTQLTPALQRIGGRSPESLRSFYPGRKGGRKEPLTLCASGRALRLAEFPGVTFLLYLPPTNASLCNHHCDAEKRSLSVVISIKRTASEVNLLPVLPFRCPGSHVK